MAVTEPYPAVLERLTHVSGRAPERCAYGDEPDQFAELWLPDGDGPHPVVVLVHGGYWRERYRLDVMNALAADLRSAGLAVWNLEYRRVGGRGGWPATFADVADGLDALVDHAGPARLAMDRVAIVGHSAGGHLALWLAARGGLPAGAPGAGPRLVPALAVALAGVADLHEGARLGLSGGAVAALLGGGPEEVGERYALASPTARTPLGVPQLLVHGDRDDSVPLDLSRRHHAAAVAAGDECELVELPGVDHFALIDPASAAWGLVRAHLPPSVGEGRVGARLDRSGAASGDHLSRTPTPTLPPRGGGSSSARSADGTPVGWERVGAGRPLVLLHGAMTDRTCWAPLAAQLSGELDLLLVDRRGRGLSPAGGRYDLAAAVEDLRAVCATLDAPPAILGWSFGAVVALEAVLGGLPCVHLVLYEPPLPVATARLPEGFRAEFVRLVEAGEIETAARLFLTRVMRLAPAVVEVMRGFPLWPSVLAAVPAARWEMEILDACTYDAARVRACRTLATVLAGTESPAHLVEASARVAGDLPGARLVRLPGQHHFAHLSDPAGFAAAVRAALAPRGEGGDDAP